jgi:hypothetical protein
MQEHYAGHVRGGVRTCQAATHNSSTMCVRGPAGTLSQMTEASCAHVAQQIMRQGACCLRAGADQMKPVCRASCSCTRCCKSGAGVQYQCVGCVHYCMCAVMNSALQPHAVAACSCSLADKCCAEYETCVSCCLAPQHNANKLYRSVLKCVNTAHGTGENIVTCHLSSFIHSTDCTLHISGQ